MKYILIAMTLLSVTRSYSQTFGIKSNLLYDATSSINLGFEIGLSKKTTFNFSSNYNSWASNTSGTNRLKHVLIQPEVRIWSNEPFNGHFFGLHIHYASYNVSGDHWLLNTFKSISSRSSSNLKDYRLEGWLGGVGVSYGYHWILGRRWGLEATLGVGFASMYYDKYKNSNCRNHIGRERGYYFGPTKTGLTLVYMIK